jgi:hypothetical protein
MTSGGPALSVVVVTRDTARTLRPIVTALARQSIAGAIELIVVAPDESVEGVEELMMGSGAFHSVRIVGAGPVQNRGRAAAAGVAACRAPVVALTENHCFPEPNWAAASLAVHEEGPWAGVGPAMFNANPETALSVAMFATGYGPFAASMPAEDRSELPLHNSSYRVDALFTFGDRLPDLMADERTLQAALLEAGHRLRFDPRPRKRHISEATWGLLAGLAYWGGRRYGGARCRDWSPLRRLAYVAAGPLLTIPIMRTAQRKLPQDGTAPTSAPLTLILLAWGALHATGEIVSYLRGTAPDDFPWVDSEEFFIRERLGRIPLTDPDIAALVAQLDGPPSRPRATA